MYTRLICIATILTTVATATVVAQPKLPHAVIGTKKGQVYPDFLLPNLDGGFGRLSDHRGKKVLLIHFASW